MAISEAHRRGNNKWDAANMKTAACKLTKSEHTAFKAYAEKHGKTISGMLLEYVRSCISTEQKQATHTLTRDEIVFLASIRGKDQILDAVRKIDEADAKSYLMWILLMADKQKDIDKK
jgi:hypothetical protein